MYCYEQKSMKEMTALLAHEVKNPVSLIKANIEFLELDTSLRTYHKNISVIKKELNKISEIISDFIFLCKPADKNNLQYHSIFHLVEELIDDFSTSMQNKQIEFELSCFCPSDETCILSDYSKIYILFLNIYKNAVEALDLNGSIKTVIYKNGRQLIVDIIDDGIGINEDLKNYVGTPFFTSKPNGSGLGISICNSIVNEFNGRFEIFNNKTTGCTVRITFNQD